MKCNVRKAFDLKKELVSERKIATIVHSKNEFVLIK